VRGGIRAVDPVRLVDRAIAQRGVAGLSRDRGVWLIAAGKASHAMAGATVRALGDHVRGGIVVAPAGSAGPPANQTSRRPVAHAPLEPIAAEHPQPGEGSLRAGRRALALAAAVRPGDDLLVLLSGGASSMLVAPAYGITLEEKRTSTGTLLRGGADIYALNTFRKHVSRIKGGRLAVACPSRCVTLVLSDVVGDDLSVIGSGPTVGDASTFADALRVVDQFGGHGAFPRAVVEYLDAGSRGEREESPKPGDPRLARAITSLIGGRDDAMAGAADAARARDYDVIVLREPVVGEAAKVADDLVRRVFDAAASREGAVCVIASGETTVQVRGDGAGGRNQELTLAVARQLAGHTRSATFASIGTDGIDGPTDAAGGIADSSTLRRIRAAGLPSVETALARNDAYRLLEGLGDLVRTGPTGTNVGDLQVFLLA
jgi:glycerate-2-kinase